MGKTESKIPSKFISFQKLEKKSDDIFGDYTQMQSPTGELFALKELIVQNEVDFKKEKNFLQMKSLIKHPNLLQLYQVQSENQNTFCSSIFKISWLFEFINRSLQQEISLRKLNGTLFTEEELWFLLLSLVSALIQLKNGHSNLKTSKIFIADNGDIKIIDPEILKTPTNYIECLSGASTKNVYISPEEMKLLKEMDYNPNVDREVCDIFTIGCILVECALLESLDEAFEYRNYKINKMKLEEKIEIIEKLYSEKLSETIERMLSFSAEKRPKFVDLKNEILENICNGIDNFENNFNDSLLENIQKLTQRNIPQKPDEQLPLKDINNVVKHKEKHTEKEKNKKNLIFNNNSEISLIEKESKTYVENEDFLLSNTFEKDDIENIPSSENTEQNNNFEENLDNCKENLPNHVFKTENNEKNDKININFCGTFNKNNESLDEGPYLFENIHQNEIYNENLEYYEENLNNNNESFKEIIHEIYEDGSVYEGEKQEGFRHGLGKFCYADGGIYYGDWKWGQMDGFGTLFYPSGKMAYEGFWKNDKFDGKGVVYNEKSEEMSCEFDYKSLDGIMNYWKQFEGDFRDDFKNGLGTLYFANGDKFSGRFAEDKANGFGSYFQAITNKTISGRWENNTYL